MQYDWKQKISAQQKEQPEKNSPHSAANHSADTLIKMIPAENERRTQQRHRQVDRPRENVQIMEQESAEQNFFTTPRGDGEDYPPAALP